MKNIYFVVIALLLFAGSRVNAQILQRIGSIPVPSIEAEGFGNMVAGMDMDGDGYKEIVIVNENQTDIANALIPRIYKYEWNGIEWGLVWSAVLDIPKQNSWPPLVYGDMDGDGRGEIIWGPINYLETGNLNPARIVVFESRGPGNDAMGVQSGDVSLPNAKWTITSNDNFNLRPFKWDLQDIDSDGKKELIFCDRATASATTYKFGIVSVSDIPNNGGGTETWTMEFSGAGITAGSGTSYDMAVASNNAYIIFSASGDIVPVTFSGGSYSIGTTVTAAVPGGSWKSACTADINNDGSKEIVVGSYSASNQKVYLLQDVLGSLTSTVIADLSPIIGTTGRIYGGATGDIDQDGKVDFIFGSRDAQGKIVRLEYAGGDITNAANYVATLIDSGYAAAGRWDILAIANVDGDAANEVLYGAGFDVVAPIIILDQTGELPVELKSFTASAHKDGVLLSWSTATETNNRGFEIERSFNGGSFGTIGFVMGSGTSTGIQHYSFIDNSAERGKYSYRLKQVDLNGTFKYSDVIEIDVNAPSDFSLEQNFPNPFNPVTTIQFGLNEDSNVRLMIYNSVGELVSTVVNEFRSAGVHKVSFNASDLPSGIYIYRLEANGKSLMNKMTLMK